MTFKSVVAIGRSLPGAEVTTTWGKPALKVQEKMSACIPSHKSAEPQSLVVMVDFAERALLLAEDPNVYYLKEHFENYPCVLVRLSRVTPDALRDLIIGAHRFIAKKKPNTKATKATKGTKSRLE